MRCCEEKGNFSQSLLYSCPGALSCRLFTAMPSGANTLWKRFETLTCIVFNYLNDLNIYVIPLHDVLIF